MLQEIMGQASITTTLDLYGTCIPGEMDRYADRLGNAGEDTDKAKIRPAIAGYGPEAGSRPTVKARLTLRLTAPEAVSCQGS
jgi:hypothetical protein